MNMKSGTSKDAADKLVRGIKRKTRKQYSAEEKIRIVLAGLRGEEITQSENVYGYRFRGQRYDCGSKAGFLQATVAFGLAREELSGEFTQFLEGMMRHPSAAE